MVLIGDCWLTVGVRLGHVLVGQALAQVRELLGRTAEEIMMGKVTREDDAVVSRVYHLASLCVVSIYWEARDRNREWREIPSGYDVLLDAERRRYCHSTRCRSRH